MATNNNQKIREMIELLSLAGDEMFPVAYKGKNYKVRASTILSYISGGGEILTELSALTDVNITNPQSEQTLVYDTVTQKWVNKKVESGSGIDEISYDDYELEVLLAKNADGTQNAIVVDMSQIKNDIDSKAGGFYVDPDTGNFMIFKDEESKSAYIDSGDESGLLGQFALGGGGGSSNVQYLITINGLAADYSYTTSSEEMNISCTFTSQIKRGDSDYEEYIEDAVISVDQYKNGSWVNIGGGLVSHGDTFTFDVKPYMSTGNNTLRFTAAGIVSSAVGVKSTTVNVTSMAILPMGLAWYNPFKEGTDYVLGGFKILGSLDKVLHIEVTGDGYFKEYTDNSIGTSQYEDIAYSFSELEHPQGTGVYNVKLWLESTYTGVLSEKLSFNIMCIAEEDIDTAQLVCVNDVADEVDNYAENTLFTYATYNGNSQTATPTITLKMGSKQIATGTYEVSVGQYATYKYSFAIDTAETTAIITATVTNGNTITEDFPLNNESTFAPISGYTFYLAAAARYNSESNKTKIINAADGSIIDATWKDMAWVDGMDGWTVDDKGNKCLLIPAMSSVTADYALMSSANTCTIEMLYKVMNVSDFDEDIIKIASDTAQSWMGVKIKPTNILLHSQSLFSNDLAQSYNTRDEELVHLAIVIAPNYQQTGNIAMIYVNGVKKCSFEWSTGDTFAHSGKLVIGSQTADLYLYMMRVYNQAFSWTQVRQNYLSSIPDAATKAQIFRKEMSVLNDRNELDYNRIKGVYNTFVVELPEGASLPNKITNPNNIAVEGTNLYIDIVQDPTCSIQGEWLDVPLEGQGTTAMTYYRWNLRSKTSSAYDKFRITAKKNVASSMHSHKMGATRLYNELNLALVGANEANGRVAVYQYPVYGFLKIPNEAAAGTYIYEPIGLYTIGPDKGDKSTFGYDNALYKNTLIHMEGTDHSPRGVGMDYPWSELTVGENKDGDMFIGAKNADGTALAETAWEIGACGDKETAADMKAYLDNEFAPAYNLDYFCTPLIVGLEAGYDINANVTSFRANVRPDGFTYADCLIYIDGEYDTYYYNINTKTYVKDGFKIYHGLTSTHGFSVDTLESKSTLASKTAYIIECRKERHRTEVGKYWLLDDSLFHACFLDLVGATDNEKKNTYPYKFGTLANGSRWRWRQDDLDTIFDVNNQGFADKKYSILNTDKQGSTMIFKGNTSYHWRCIREYYKDELKGMMQRILQKMVDMCPVTYGTSIREKLIGSIRYFFWDYAQEYFTQGAYNIDAKWTYEDTWALYKKDTSINAVHPLQQLLGSHYEAEKAWVAMRVLFIASMYEFGTFVDYIDKSEGQISFRQGGDFTFDLTPAIDMRPSVIQGQNATIIHASGRINAGDSTTIQTEADTSADTMVYIQGADWLSDIGDFSQVQIGSSSSAFSVTSKRLKSLKVGDVTASSVTTNIGALNFGLCPSMIEVEARNVSNLAGDVNLTTLPRLRRAYFSGTKATSIQLPDGSKVTALDLPSTIQRMKLIRLPLLMKSGLTYTDLNNLTYLWVEDNAYLDGYDMLKAALEDGSPLNNIRVLGIDKRNGDNTDVDFFKALADGDYHGINASGSVDNTIKPYLQGKLYVTGSVDGDTFDYIREAFPSMTFDADKIVAFIKFDDPEVLSILRANGVDTNSDGGITKEEAAAVTSIGTWFKGNKTITSFEEFEKFIGVTSISGGWYTGAFDGCTSLETINLPESITSLGVACFNGCSGLKSITLPDAITYIGDSAFKNCSQLVIDGLKLPNLKTVGAEHTFMNTLLSGELNLPSLSSVGMSSFAYTQISSVTSLGSLTTLPDSPHDVHGLFLSCTQLKSVVLPSTLTKIGQRSFMKCTALETIISDWVNITSIGNNAFYNCTSLSFDELNLPNLTSLGQNAFYGVKIKKLVLGSEGVALTLPTATSSNQNYGDKSVLEEVELYGVTSIPERSFVGYNNLKVINELKDVVSVNADAFNSCSSLSVDMVLPKMTTLGAAAFYKSGITSFIANSLETITAGYEPVASCPNLKRVELRSIKSISSDSVFRNNPSLEEVILSNNLTYLGRLTFQNCKKLKNIELGENIQTLNGGVFELCIGLEFVICKAVTPPSGVNNYTFQGSSCPIYVPDASVEAYKNATGWINYADRIKPLSEYVES